MRELALLQRMRSSPYGGALLANAILGVDCGDKLLWTPRKCVPWGGEAVDAWLTLSSADLDSVLSGGIPSGNVSYRIGDRDAAPRMRQAHGVLALATIGWCGPWPDANAALEHDARLRDAVFNVVVGANDGVGNLFAIEQLSSAGRALGLADVNVRLTDGARPCLTTINLGTGALTGDELRTTLGVQSLRIAAAEIRSADAVPSSADIDGSVVYFQSVPLPLATKIARLWEMTTRRPRA